MQLDMADRLACLHGPYRRVVVIEFLEDLGAVLDVTRQAVDGNAEDHVDPLALRFAIEGIIQTTLLILATSG